MHNAATPAERARQAIQSVLNGNAPNGTRPDDCDKYAPWVQGVFDAYTIDGTAGARKAWGAIVKTDKGAAQFISGSEETDQALPRVISAQELVTKVFAPVKWIVPDILPEGITLFAGKPKMGKSWLALNLAIATATGGRALGRIQVEQGSVLYLALEDNERRLQSRMVKLLQGGRVPERLDLAIEWQRMGDDTLGLTWLAGWIEAHPDARLIVIDTLAKVRPPMGKGGNIYDYDYSTVQGLKGIADRYNVSILIVHHVRKGSSEDPLEMISGSFGLSGGVDGAIVLARIRGAADAVLHITGRDVEEKELAMTWSAEYALWTIAGDAEEFRVSRERRGIIEAIKQIGGNATPKDISEVLDKPVGSIKKLLREMLDDGQIRQGSYGRYDSLQ